MMQKLTFEDIKILGSDFIRNIGIYIAQHFKKNNEANLIPVLKKFVQEMMSSDHLIEALDMVLEANEFSLL